MPELPEVETVRSGLAPALEGQRIESVDARRPDLRFPLPQAFAERIAGATVKSLTRRAKYLVALLSTEEALIMHLGMSGRFSIVNGNGTLSFDNYAYSTGGNAKHDHVIFHLQNGVQIIYNDPRRFGFMDIVPSGELGSCSHFAKMGPEPLGEEFDAVKLGSAFKSKKTPIKAALLDQQNVAGLGNIYVCEALFRSHVHPQREAGSLGKAELKKLTAAIKAVLLEAIEAGGSTLRDFADANGSLGGFQERFDVYAREGHPCRCGKKSAQVQRIVQSGRSTFFCAVCQK
jgi:formamidopyrimidine-DNA glycosylase